MRFSDLLGTSKNFFKIGLGALSAAIKSTSGGISIRNADDSADAPLTASILKASGDSIEINSDATGAGADRKLTLARALAGMSQDLLFRMPADYGTAGFSVVTDGAGNLSFAPSAAATNLEATDTTDLTFGSTTTVAMFTLPADAVVVRVQVIIDESFDAGSLTVGTDATPAKYMAANQVELDGAAGTIYEVNPSLQASGTAEDLIITYAAAGATEGAARVLVTYVIPS